MSKKNILIIGPISESGGREINSIFFLEQFTKKYHTSVFSTIPVSSLSIVDEYLGEKKMNSFERVALKSFFIRCFSQIIKRKNNLQIENLFLVKNKISKLFFDFDKLYGLILKKEISNKDIVFYSGLLTDKWLHLIVELCHQNNKKLIIRVTGSLKNETKYSNIVKDEKIVVHSLENFEILKNEGFTNVKCIEQSSSLERELLQLNISFQQPLKFGYLGRMSHEKGLEIIVDTFKKNKLELRIAGSGPLNNQIVNLTNNYPQIVKEHFIPYKNVPEFLSKIDVLLVLSKHEGGPLVGIEAMAAGKIVLSTKVGAMTQRLNLVDKDLFVTEHSEEELTNTIKSLLQKNRSEIYALKNKMREYYLDYASNEVVMTQYFQFIDS
ncbi:glycosyltransferase [Olleya sp. UBA1516]|uniref:glycosyltransferase n=1 Tax=Olleya sp. UBA1516 TaxID=1947013 RepID=UPI0025FF6A54|nr:glycosyltransferase [Olleya sp. UBA1516]|tara:strand:- start:870 stop:2012 length:1143 start_codon:yes stop_codon:yes gene_type:complete